MAMHSAAAQDACWAGVAPTVRAASMMSRMVEAKPTTTAVVVAEIRLDLPHRDQPIKRRVMPEVGEYAAQLFKHLKLEEKAA